MPAKKKKNILEQFGDVLTKAGKLLKGPYRVASGAVVAAALGGLLKLTSVTETFPPPSDIVGNIIIFVAVILFVFDVAKGGLYD